MRLVMLVLATVLLAGCSEPAATPTPADDAPADDPAVATLPWGMTGCRSAIVIVPADRAAVEALLPSGFRSLSPPEVLDPSAPASPQANLGLEMFRCTNVHGLNATVSDGSYGSIFTQVEAPPEMTNASYGLVFFKWDTLVADAALRVELGGAGLAVHDGSADFQTWSGQSNGLLFEGVLRMKDLGAVTFRGATSPDFPAPAGFEEFSDATGGLAVWRTMMHGAAFYAGTAVVQAAAPSLAADILGTSPVTGIALAGTSDFTSASVTLPG